MTERTTIWDIVGECPALSNAGLHSFLFRERLYNRPQELEGWCQYCTGFGYFTRHEYDVFIIERDKRRAAARRRRDPKSGSR